MLWNITTSLFFYMTTSAAKNYLFTQAVLSKSKSAAKQSLLRSVLSGYECNEPQMMRFCTRTIKGSHSAQTNSSLSISTAVFSFCTSEAKSNPEQKHSYKLTINWHHKLTHIYKFKLFKILKLKTRFRYEHSVTIKCGDTVINFGHDKPS